MRSINLGLKSPHNDIQYKTCQISSIFQSKKINKKGFTLLEVLIAIFVMAVGILSIVSLMTHNLSIINRVHLQTTATTLAREGMEMVTNVRDTNTMLGYEWNCAERSTQQDVIILNANPNNSIATLCKKFFWTGGMIQSQFTIEGGLLQDKDQIQMKYLEANNLSGSQLFLTGINIDGTILTGFTHDGGSKSDFSRYIEFTGMNGIATNSPLYNQIYPVRSIVRYNRNGLTGEVVFESFIANQE